MEYWLSKIFTNIENSEIIIGSENSTTFVDGSFRVAKNATMKEFIK